MTPDGQLETNSRSFRSSQLTVCQRLAKLEGNITATRGGELVGQEQMSPFGFSEYKRGSQTHLYESVPWTRAGRYATSAP